MPVLTNLSIDFTLPLIVSILSIVIANYLTWRTDHNKEDLILKNKRLTYIDRFNLEITRLNAEFDDLIRDMGERDFFMEKSINNAINTISLLQGLNQEVVILAQVDLRRKIITAVGAAGVLINDIQSLEKVIDYIQEKYDRSIDGINKDGLSLKVDLFKSGIVMDENGTPRLLYDVDLNKKLEAARSLVSEVLVQLEKARKKLDHNKSNKSVEEYQKQYDEIFNEYHSLKVDLFKSGIVMDEHGDLSFLERDNTKEKEVGISNLIRDITLHRDDVTRFLDERKSKIKSRRQILVARIVEVKRELGEVIPIMEKLRDELVENRDIFKE